MSGIANLADFEPRPIASLEKHLELALQPTQNGRYVSSYLHPEDPFFWLGDTAWELFHRLDKAEAVKYLKNRAAKGFNVVMIVVMAEHNGLDYPDRFGSWPFLPLPAAPEHVDAEGKPQYRPDFTRPNPVFFKWIDWVVDAAADLGIRVALVPSWGRYVNGGYYGSPILFTPDLGYTLAYFLGERYPFTPFIVGGDSNRYWNNEWRAISAASGDITNLPLHDSGDVVEAMAQGLIAGEKAGIKRLQKNLDDYKTFIIYHSAQVWLPQGPVSTGSAQFPNAEWLSMDAVQTGHHDGPHPPSIFQKETDESATVDPSEGQAGVSSNNPLSIPELWRAKSAYVPIRQMYKARSPSGSPRPVIDLEAHYENTNHWFREQFPVWRADDIRKGAWQGLLSGACGLTYGCNSIWQMHKGDSKTHPPIAPPTNAYCDWDLELDLPGAFQVSMAKSIMLSLPSFFERVPDSSFILSEKFEVPEEQEMSAPAGDKLICGTKVAGSWAMVQLPYGGKVEVDVEKALGSAVTWRAWWIDPRTAGREILNRGKVRDEKVAEFIAPSENEDWLLFIEKI